MEDKACFVVDKTREICETFGGRGAGSREEEAAQHYFADMLRDMNGRVTVEKFDVHPFAFMAFDYVFGLCSLLSIALVWLGRMGFAWAVWIFGFVSVVMELVLYREFLDPFYPNRTSHNVVAKFPVEGAKRRVIVSGHCDSAFCWTFNRWSPAVIWLSHVLQMGSSVIAFATLVYPTYGTGTIIVHIICGVLLLSTLINTQFWRPVPGANDNLTGALGSVAVAQHFIERPDELRNTEIWAVITGSEEIGLRGAKAFARAHELEITGGDGVETIFIGLETLRDMGSLSVAHRDMNGFVRADPRLVNLLRQASHAELGYKLPKQSVFCGSTDCAALTQRGVPACCIEALPTGPATWYHTMADNPDNMSAECIEAALRVTVRAISMYDQHGLAYFGKDKSDLRETV